MWIVTLISSLKIEEGFGVVQTIGWFPSVRNAEDFISENRKNLHNYLIAIRRSYTDHNEFRE